MAPIACLVDCPIVGSGISSNACDHHRTVRNSIISKRQRLTLKKNLPKIAEGIRSPASTLSTDLIRVADIPTHPMLPEANLPVGSAIKRTLVINNRKELMDIVIRTLALVRRNYLLQVRLDSLRLEAKNFFQSVLDNTENQNCQENHDKTMIINNEHLGSNPSSIDDNIHEKQIISLSFSNKTSILFSNEKSNISDNH